MDVVRTAVAAPEPDLREHCRQFHPRITLRGQNDVKVARAHSSDHYHFGSASHHHGPNPGPHARPEGWRTGGGVVLIDRQAAMRPRRYFGDGPRPVVYVTVTFPDAEAARAARIDSVTVSSNSTGPADEPLAAVYRAEVNGSSELLYPSTEWGED